MNAGQQNASTMHGAWLVALVRTRSVVWLAALLLPPLILLSSSIEVNGQAAANAGVQVQAVGADVRLSWRMGGEADQLSFATAEVGLPLQPFAGYLLPIHLETVELQSDQPVAAQIAHIESIAWDGHLTLAEMTPAALDMPPDPAFAPSSEPRLPSAPITLLREGTMRDTRIAVVAISPIYQGPDDPTPRLALELDALISGGAPVTDSAALWAESFGDSTGAVRHVVASENPPAPTNPLASKSAIKVSVANSGIQRVTGTALGAAGLNLGATDPAKLHLYLRGVEVPLHVIDRSPAGQLNDSDEIRFYAPAPGDRWNATDTYWLAVQSNPGMRMSSRSVAPQGGSVATRNTALERGVWETNAIYDSTLWSQEDEHWFAAAMIVGPTTSPSDYPTLSAKIDTVLPLASGSGEPSTFRIRGIVHDRRDRDAFNRPIGPTIINHKLQAKIGGTTTLFE
ncbi:MAG: hypothetical protein HC802_04625 [Caldilineaceae bacterium]|nr:hypothetical protein [Caldilineaceae bacterium]